MIKYLFLKVKNPLIEDNLYNRFNEWLCGRTYKNCIKRGSYYGMPQAWCARCGHKNRGYAAEHVSEWHIPDRLDKLR
jgi:hypothetical protein